MIQLGKTVVVSTSSGEFELYSNKRTLAFAVTDFAAPAPTKTGRMALARPCGAVGFSGKIKARAIPAGGDWRT